jgi:hypothetical protein
MNTLKCWKNNSTIDFNTVIPEQCNHCKTYRSCKQLSLLTRYQGFKPGDPIRVVTGEYFLHKTGVVLGYIIDNPKLLQIVVEIDKEQLRFNHDALEKIANVG